MPIRIPSQITVDCKSVHYIRIGLDRLNFAAIALSLAKGMLWGVILNNLALIPQRPLNRLFAWSCTIGESDLMLCTDSR